MWCYFQDCYKRPSTSFLRCHDKVPQTTALKWQNSGDQKSKFWEGWRLWGRILLCFYLASSGAGNTRHPLASRCIASISALVVTWCSPCANPSKCPSSSKNTSHIGCRAHPNSVWPHLNYISKDPNSRQSHNHRSWVDTDFWRTLLTQYELWLPSSLHSLFPHFCFLEGSYYIVSYTMERPRLQETKGGLWPTSSKELSLSLWRGLDCKEPRENDSGQHPARNWGSQSNNDKSAPQQTEHCQNALSGVETGSTPS